MVSDRSRIVIDVSSVLENVSEILENHLAWQAQYLVMLEDAIVAPRIVNSVSCVTRIDHESHFAWQAQYLVKLKCHFSWLAQHSVKFGMIAGARNVVFFNTKCSWWA